MFNALNAFTNLLDSSKRSEKLNVETSIEEAEAILQELTRQIDETSIQLQQLKNPALLIKLSRLNSEKKSSETKRLSLLDAIARRNEAVAHLEQAKADLQRELSNFERYNPEINEGAARFDETRLAKIRLGLASLKSSENQITKSWLVNSIMEALYEQVSDPASHKIVRSYELIEQDKATLKDYETFFAQLNEYVLEGNILTEQEELEVNQRYENWKTANDRIENSIFSSEGFHDYFESVRAYVLKVLEGDDSIEESTLAAINPEFISTSSPREIGQLLAERGINPSRSFFTADDLQLILCYSDGSELNLEKINSIMQSMPDQAKSSEAGVVVLKQELKDPSRVVLTWSGLMYLLARSKPSSTSAGASRPRSGLEQPPETQQIRVKLLLGEIGTIGDLVQRNKIEVSNPTIRPFKFEVVRTPVDVRESQSNGWPSISLLSRTIAIRSNTGPVREFINLYELEKDVDYIIPGDKVQFLSPAGIKKILEYNLKHNPRFLEKLSNDFPIPGGHALTIDLLVAAIISQSKQNVRYSPYPSLQLFTLFLNQDSEAARIGLLKSSVTDSREHFAVGVLQLGADSLILEKAKATNYVSRARNILRNHLRDTHKEFAQDALIDFARQVEDQITANADEELQLIKRELLEAINRLLGNLTQVETARRSKVTTGEFLDTIIFNVAYQFVTPQLDQIASVLKIESITVDQIMAELENTGFRPYRDYKYEDGRLKIKKQLQNLLAAQMLASIGSNSLKTLGEMLKQVYSVYSGELASHEQDNRQTQQHLVLPKEDPSAALQDLNYYLEVLAEDHGQSSRNDALELLLEMVVNLDGHEVTLLDFIRRRFEFIFDEVCEFVIEVDKKLPDPWVSYNQGQINHSGNPQKPAEAMVRNAYYADGNLDAKSEAARDFIRKDTDISIQILRSRIEDSFKTMPTRRFHLKTFVQAFDLYFANEESPEYEMARTLTKFLLNSVLNEDSELQDRYTRTSWAGFIEFLETRLKDYVKNTHADLDETEFADTVVEESTEELEDEINLTDADIQKLKATLESINQGEPVEFPQNCGSFEIYEEADLQNLFALITELSTDAELGILFGNLWSKWADKLLEREQVIEQVESGEDDFISQIQKLITENKNREGKFDFTLLEELIAGGELLDLAEGKQNLIRFLAHDDTDRNRFLRTAKQEGFSIYPQGKINFRMLFKTAGNRKYKLVFIGSYSEYDKFMRTKLSSL